MVNNYNIEKQPYDVRRTLHLRRNILIARRNGEMDRLKREYELMFPEQKRTEREIYQKKRAELFQVDENEILNFAKNAANKFCKNNERFF